MKRTKRIDDRKDIRFKLPPEMHDKLAALALQGGVDLSKMSRRLIERSLGSQEAFYAPISVDPELWVKVGRAATLIEFHWKDIKSRLGSDTVLTMNHNGKEISNPIGSLWRQAHDWRVTLVAAAHAVKSLSITDIANIKKELEALDLGVLNRMPVLVSWLRRMGLIK